MNNTDHLVLDHHDHDERVEFALFLKVLLRCLEKSKQYVLLQQARMAVMTCTNGYKMGNPSFSPLIDAIEIRLKKLVGDSIWTQARNYTKFYLRRKQYQSRYLSDHSRIAVKRPIIQIWFRGTWNRANHRYCIIRKNQLYPWSTWSILRGTRGSCYWCAIWDVCMCNAVLLTTWELISCLRGKG